jgi:hypothetical protein
MACIPFDSKWQLETVLDWVKQNVGEEYAPVVCSIWMTAKFKQASDLNTMVQALAKVNLPLDKVIPPECAEMVQAYLDQQPDLIDRLNKAIDKSCMYKSLT